MKEKMTKTQFKAFFLPDYEDEEKYLSDMHRNGWKLKKAYPYFYTFEKCTPENVVYKLDFGNISGDKTAYINMFGEYGWEYIQKLNNFYYFRKTAKDGLPDEELEIFSDNESRLKMVDKIINTRFVPGIIFFIIGFVCICIALIESLIYPTPIKEVVIILLAFIVYIFFFSMLRYCYMGLKNLKSKFEKRE